MKNIVCMVLVIIGFATGVVFAYAKTTPVAVGTASSITTPKTTTKKPIKKPVQKFEKLVYYTPGESSFASLQMHGQYIGIFAPQVYNVDETGKLSGKISEKAWVEINKNKTPVMPLVFQKGFSADIMNTILHDDNVQNLIIEKLIAEAKTNNYIGWQFDFEKIHSSNRDAYSSFVEKTAQRFHGENLKLSVAVITRVTENAADLPAGSWDYWAGVFDYKRIGAAADFVTIMTYDDPYSIGPVARLSWVKQVVTHMKKFIPASKISLGIPTYGWVWDMDTNTRIKSVPYDKYLQLVVNKKFNKKGYDKKLETNWITYTEPDAQGIMRHYKLWYEDKQSFTLKYNYAKSQKLRGVSIWVMGMEDDNIWKQMK